MGVVPGPRLTVYVLVGSGCGQCQHPETMDAIRGIRKALLAANPAFRSANVVGVALDAELSEGLDYLQLIGLTKFDEISVGNMWVNEHLARLVWRDGVTQPAVPQAIIVASDVAAEFDPFHVAYGGDSVVAVVRGRRAMVQWAAGGFTAVAAREAARARGVASEPMVP